MSGLRNIHDKRNTNSSANNATDHDNIHVDDRSFDDRRGGRRDHREAFQQFQNTVKNPFSRSSMASGNLAIVQKALDGYITGLKNQGKLTLGSTEITAKTVVVLTEDTCVAVPSVTLLFSVPAEEDGQAVTHAYAHAIMLVDNSNTPQAINFENQYYKRENITDPTIWADAWDNVYLTELGVIVQRENLYPGQTVQLKNGGSTAIDVVNFQFPVEANGTTTSNQQLDAVLFEVVSNLFSLMCTKFEVNSHTVTPAALQGLTVVANMDLNAYTVSASNNDPISQDWEIEIQTQSNLRDMGRERRHTLNNGATSTDSTYGCVFGGFDFVLTESEASRKRIRQPYPEDLASFIPEFIVRGFRQGNSLVTLPIVMQLIGAVGMLAINDGGLPYWTHAFHPARVGGNTSRNLGALAMEIIDPTTGKPANRVTLRDGANDDFEDLVHSTIIPNTYRVGIDVPSQGPTSRLLSVFSRAADYALNPSSVEGRIANEEIIRAIDVLTDNRFSAKWGWSTPIMTPQASLMPGGYWLDSDGKRRDVRDLGYLAFANYADENTARDYSEAWLDCANEEDEIIAVNRRLELIRALREANFIHCENYRRCYINPEAYMVLVESVAEAGVEVMVPNINHRSRSNKRYRMDNVQGIINGGPTYHRHYGGNNHNGGGASGGRYSRYGLGY